MRILAIETSCDETAIAIADFFGTRSRPRIRVRANIVSSQVALHAKFGGIVPNLAKREHQKNLPTILLRAFKEGRFLISNSKFLISKQIQNSKIEKIEKILEREPELWKQFKKHIMPLKKPGIGAIAVTYGPGLAPALWVGVNFAKALARLWNIPIVPVNHMAGHLFSALLKKSGKKNFQFSLSAVQFPAIALLASGGHTELVLMRGYGKYKIIGETADDAAGEAFDKVARLLKLGYPGGPAISALAKKSQTTNYKLQTALPRPMLNSKDYNFSFSGLKTAALYLLRDRPALARTVAGRTAIAKEFQDAVAEVLVAKTVRAAKAYRAKTVLLGGGVAANQLLRKNLKAAIDSQMQDAHCRLPLFELTGDNALMIALAAFLENQKPIAPDAEFSADARARLG